MKALNPTLWRTCRAVSIPTRLNLLRALFRFHESSVATLARETRISEPMASIQLRALNSRGLISARPSGKWVFYSDNSNLAIESSAMILEALRECCAVEMKNTELIEMATAFTHQRRIAIVKSLDSGSKPLGQLSIATQIPPPSLYRHLAKLENRKVVLSEGDLYCLALPENPLGKTLLEIATS